ncbi:hypothetical protein M8C21_031202 [Ambrosia artemisiifolia]|uniref:Uncharacterized protein n=1 Tax=Ambrosia artemisiifolia TaxID=4212 RepID=A0AAD5BKA4_AMBAR|nr:hypothetical protein M8C21_031202 [Ambrosia artemisiifolia]
MHNSHLLTHDVPYFILNMFVKPRPVDDKSTQNATNLDNIHTTVIQSE